MTEELYAFPYEAEKEWKGTQGAYKEKSPKPGMTLRDYFAAKAMQGLLTCGDYDDFEPEVLATLSYDRADAMLKAREVK